MHVRSKRYALSRLRCDRCDVTLTGALIDMIDYNQAPIFTC